MPIYEYQCDNCGCVHEHLCRYEDRPEVRDCPRCCEMAFPVLSAASVRVEGDNAANGYGLRRRDD